jgi:integrase
MIETKTQRARLKVQHRPYWEKLQGKVGLGYRRVATGAGTWSVRIANGKGGYNEKTLGIADDIEAANGKEVLSFTQARDSALRFSRGEGEAPVTLKTLAEAVDAYEAELETRNGCKWNVGRIRKHLPPTMLKRPLATITPEELRNWRNGLVKRLDPAGVNRLMNVLKAALNLAAKHGAKLDPKWRNGLETLPNTQRANNVVLSEETVARLVHAARAYEENFGLLVEVMAQTGERYSQICRCQVQDLLPEQRRLMVPSSFKGGRNKKQVLIPVALSDDLIARLRLAAGNRPATAPLLRKKSGDRWKPRDIDHRFDNIVKAIGEDPERVTSIALRHTHITWQLLNRIPVAAVSQLHDTSPQIIAKHYAASIASHVDDMVRDAMMQFDRPQDNVVPLRRQSDVR